MTYDIVESAGLTILYPELYLLDPVLISPVIFNSTLPVIICQTTLAF